MPKTSTKHRSIGERMQRAKSLDAREKAATDWALNWQEDYDGLISDLEQAVSRRDFDRAARVTGQLKAAGEKRFPALHKVISALADDDI